MIDIKSLFDIHRFYPPAIQGALNVPDASMGYTLLIDSIDYAIWVMFLLGMVPFAKIFNRWTRANARVLDQAGSQLAQAPLYILSGFVILVIHGVLLTLIAKIFKLDLFVRTD